MPVAMPTWRNVLAAPVDMPLRSGGTTETEPEASTGLVMPMPTPHTRNPGSSTSHDEVARDVGHELAADGHEGEAQAHEEPGLDAHRELAGDRAPR